MPRLLPGALALLASLAAYAQSAPEPPVERASPIAIIVFVILFFGSGVAYAAYLWWTHKKDGKEGDQ
jgi:hypothetical protein